MTAPKVITVAQIKSNLLRPALTSHYQVEITPPETEFLSARLGESKSLDPNKVYDKITLGCVEASLPGSSLATIDIDNDYHGVSEKHGYRRIYDDRIDFTFFVDAEEYYVIRYFEAWMAYIVNEQLTNFDKPNYTYRINYPGKDKNNKGGYYANLLTITKFEKDFNNSKSLGLKYTFINAFPINIQSMPVSYEQSNLLKCSVSFSYSRYIIDEGYKRRDISASKQEPSPSSPLSQSLSQASEALRTNPLAR